MEVLMDKDLLALGRRQLGEELKCRIEKAAFEGTAEPPMPSP